MVLDARMPSLSSFFPTRKPFAVRSTTNAVIPRYPFDGSTVANTTKRPASAPFVIQSLRPLSTHPPLVAVARVCNANASEPLAASESA